MKSRLLSVDLLRTLSILSVLLIHVRSTGQVAESHGFFAQLGNLASRNGSYGVIVFFVISGFLISRMIHARFGSLQRVRLKEFYLRRAARILPLLVVILITGTLFSNFWPESAAKTFAWNAPGSQRDMGFWISIGLFFFNWHRIVLHQTFGLHWDVLWSLSIEEQFYIFYPLFLASCKSPRSIVALLLTFSVMGAIARAGLGYFYPDHWLLLFTNSFTGFEAIALGGLVFLAHENGWARTSGQKWRWAGAVSLTLGYFITDLGHASSLMWGTSWIALSTAALLLGLTHWDPGEGRWVRLLASPGRLSYGIYLWHALAIAICWNALGSLNFGGQAALVAVTAWALAWLSSRVIEEPAVRRWG